MRSGDTLISISRERITDELKEFVIVAIYLYVCFTALAYLKFAILHAHGIGFAPFGLAAVTFDQLIATTGIGLLVLIPFFAFRALGERLGEGNLFRLFFGNRGKAQRT